MNLEPIDPDSALELYLADRENNITQATLYSHRSRLGHFVRWCDDQEITNLNELTGRQLHEYRLWRRDEGELAPATEKTQMDTLRVMWHTMMRVGAVHALDCNDYDASDQSLQLVHRPETGTPLKNAEQDERHIALSREVRDLLDDWLADRRPEITEESGRKPLVTTPQGRAHKTTLRGDCYRYTRPCVTIGECPHDRVIEECPATEYDAASECPSSVSPRASTRRHHLRAVGRVADESRR